MCISIPYRFSSFISYFQRYDIQQPHSIVMEEITRKTVFFSPTVDQSQHMLLEDKKTAPPEFAVCKEFIY
jgi:hypothetical protein